MMDVLTALPSTSGAGPFAAGPSETAVVTGGPAFGSVLRETLDADLRAEPRLGEGVSTDLTAALIAAVAGIATPLPPPTLSVAAGSLQTDAGATGAVPAGETPVGISVLAMVSPPSPALPDGTASVAGTAPAGEVSAAATVAVGSRQTSVAGPASDEVRPATAGADRAVGEGAETAVPVEELATQLLRATDAPLPAAETAVPLVQVTGDDALRAASMEATVKRPFSDTPTLAGDWTDEQTPDAIRMETAEAWPVAASAGAPVAVDAAVDGEPFAALAATERAGDEDERATEDELFSPDGRPVQPASVTVVSGGEAPADVASALPLSVVTGVGGAQGAAPQGAPVATLDGAAPSRPEPPRTLAAAQATLSTGAPPTARTVDQVAESLALTVREGRTEATLSLRPAALGEVKVQIVAGQDGLVIRISAERESVGELLRTRMGELHQALVGHQVAVAELHVLHNPAPVAPANAAEEPPFWQEQRRTRGQEDATSDDGAPAGDDADDEDEE